jgi:hypothetical protein
VGRHSQEVELSQLLLGIGLVDPTPDDKRISARWVRCTTDAGAVHILLSPSVVLVLLPTCLIAGFSEVPSTCGTDSVVVNRSRPSLRRTVARYTMDRNSRLLMLYDISTAFSFVSD